MKPDMKWGTAAAIAIAAAVGISSQSANRTRKAQTVAGRAGQVVAGPASKRKPIRPACSDLIDLFQAFLLRSVVGPKYCYEPDDRSDSSTADNSRSTNSLPKFVIATLP